MTFAAMNTPRTIEIFSKPHTIDRIYKSMEGITDAERFLLPSQKIKPSEDLKPAELVWVTAGKIDILNEKDGSEETEKHLCHAYMKFDNHDYKTNHRYELKQKTNQFVRLFSFVQGQPEIRLPEGYGIPALSKELFEFQFMVINPIPVDDPYQVKAKGTFTYIPDDELQDPLNPLFMRIVGMKIPIKKDDNKPATHCSELGDIPNAEPAPFSMHKIHKNLDNDYEQVYHWMVPPGRHEYRYLLEPNVLASMPFDTTVHYINSHLHPHGESIEFRDLTTDETLFISTATNDDKRTSLLNLTDFSSEKGIPIHRDHKYEMITVYDNKTGGDIDAMAILFFYLLDKTFDKGDLKSPDVI